MERLIFHVDVNSAFLSWEAARRVSQGLEDLRAIPAAIGGDPEKRTGVVLAKSIPAKRFGVQTGEPIAAALRKCPGLVLARPDFQLYENCSRAFIQICRSYAPILEQVSIDECFLDMSGTDYLYPDPVQTAHALKEEIREKLGFTVNVGISVNRLLAKMASDFEKPDRVHTLFQEELAVKLWPLPVGELFTVGKASAERLRRAGYSRIGDLAAAEPEMLQRLLGQKQGRQLWEYAQGIDDSPVQAEPEEAKGYSISTTLEEDVVSSEAAKRILLSLADSIAAHMRREGAQASCVAVSIRSNDFKNRSHQRHLDLPTDLTDEIYSIAGTLFDELWDRHTPLRLLGIALTDISRGDAAQASLFIDEKREKARRRDLAIDAIRGKFGADMIQRGASLTDGTPKVGRRYKAQLENDREAAETTVTE